MPREEKKDRTTLDSELKMQYAGPEHQWKAKSGRRALFKGYITKPTTVVYPDTAPPPRGSTATKQKK